MIGNIQNKEECVVKEFKVLLSSVVDLKEFVGITGGYSFEIDLVSGRYIVDAKSIMGILSLDLTKPINVEVHREGADADKFYTQVKKFIV